MPISTAVPGGNGVWGLTAVKRRWGVARHNRCMTNFPRRYTLVALVAALLWIVIPGALAAELRAAPLLNEHKCSICHADREPRTGPSYAEIAARYRGEPDAVDRIAARVTRGAHGSALWHMPPHPELSRAEARAIARYILSRKQEGAHHAAADAGPG